MATVYEMNASAEYLADNGIGATTMVTALNA